MILNRKLREIGSKIEPHIVSKQYCAYAIKTLLKFGTNNLNLLGSHHAYYKNSRVIHE